MGKRNAEEMKSEVLQVLEENRNRDREENQIVVADVQHPYAFHVSGPRNVPSINWRDIISSTWSALIFTISFQFWISM